jgi:hypothetical protein
MVERGSPSTRERRTVAGDGVASRRRFGPGELRAAARCGWGRDGTVGMGGRGTRSLGWAATSRRRKWRRREWREGERMVTMARSFNDAPSYTTWLRRNRSPSSVASTSERCALDIKYLVLISAVEAQIDVKLLRLGTTPGGIYTKLCAKTSDADEVTCLFFCGAAPDPGDAMSFVVDLYIQGSARDGPLIRWPQAADGIMVGSGAPSPLAIMLWMMKM